MTTQPEVPPHFPETESSEWRPASLPPLPQPAPFSTAAAFSSLASSCSLLRVFQVLDSSFPVGGFAHSNGLEAAVAFRVVTDRPSLLRFLRLQLTHTAASQLPTIRHAHRICSPISSPPPPPPVTLQALDGWYDSTCTSSIQRAASSTLGQSFLSTFLSTQPPQPSPSTTVTSHLSPPLPHHHFPVVWSLCLTALHVPLPLLLSLHLYLTLRSLLSAAVRLDLVGPREAQSLLSQLSAEECAELAEKWKEAELHSTYGLHEVDLLCQSHGRLFTRLFVT